MALIFELSQWDNPWREYMKKARLGFKIFSTDDELLVEEDKDFIRKEKDHEWAVRQREKARKRRWWAEHKRDANRRRRTKAATISGRYKASRNKAIGVGQRWELTQEEWAQIWIDAGWVILPGTVSATNPAGVRRTAYSMRGPNKLTNTMMARRKLDEPWNTENCYIVFRSAPLVGGQYHANTPGF